MNITRLKEVREDKDLLQKDIAKVLHITQVQYSRYELGVNNIPVEKLNILADFYKTSTDYLLHRTDERKPYSKPLLSDNKSKKEYSKMN